VVRTVAISLKAHPEQLNLIGRAAEMLGKTRSDFVLEAACEKARSVLLDRESLEEVRFREFSALLDAPVQPNPGLERLLAVKLPWQAGDTTFEQHAQT
jgi:uncharacterized protein (DUF1778 family)